MRNKSNCCSHQNYQSNIKKGILFSLLPHTFCIAFIIFSVLGATTLTNFLKPFLLTTHFFSFLVLLSIVLATLSAAIYLNNNNLFSWIGIKRKIRYLILLYLTIVGINLLLFLVIFPLAANLNNFNRIQLNRQEQQDLSMIVLKVNIPCSGHAPLVIEELRKIKGVLAIKYRLPNLFEVNYDATAVSPYKILKSEIFNTFKARII